MGDVTTGVCFRFFGQVYRVLGANPTGCFFDSCFFGNYANILVFRALDWFCRISRAKIMEQKLNFGPKLKRHTKDMIYPLRENLASHNSAAD